MHVIRQYYPCVNFEEVTLFDRTDDLSQHVDMLDEQIASFAFEEIDGEEIGAARMPGASVI